MYWIFQKVRLGFVLGSFFWPSDHPLQERPLAKDGEYIQVRDVETKAIVLLKVHTPSDEVNPNLMSYELITP